MKRNLVIGLMMVMATAITTIAWVGCGKNVHVHPGAINAFDSQAADDLLIVQTVLGDLNAKASEYPKSLPYLQEATKDYDTAQQLYAAWVATATATGSTAVPQNVQDAIVKAKSSAATAQRQANAEDKPKPTSNIDFHGAPPAGSVVQRMAARRMTTLTPGAAAGSAENPAPGENSLPEPSRGDTTIPVAALIQLLALLGSAAGKIVGTRVGGKVGDEIIKDTDLGADMLAIANHALAVKAQIDGVPIEDVRNQLHQLPVPELPTSGQ
jgi:hypothetical protein